MMTYCISDKLAEFPAFKHTGIDPFDQRLTAEYLYEKLKNKKTAIKIALLDQEIICGIGNIYASEALFGASILPTRYAKFWKKQSRPAVRHCAITASRTAVSVIFRTSTAFTTKPDSPARAAPALRPAPGESGKSFRADVQPFTVPPNKSEKP